MGRTGTYNYQIHIEIGSGRYQFFGAMKYEEAKGIISNKKAKKAFIWPQTKVAKNKIRKNGYGNSDYLELTYDPILKIYSVSGRKYGD